MTCIVCGIVSDTLRCVGCWEIYHFVTRLTSPQKLDYVLIVDGSHSPEGSGAGLVLAREYDEVVIAACAINFKCVSSDRAEIEAIRRGRLWAPLDVVWSDNKAAIRASGKVARYIRPDMRDPLHNLAHRLANVGRKNEWSRLDALWYPGEVWP